MNLNCKLFSHCEVCCSNDLYILNDSYIVWLASKIKHNWTLTIFLVRLHSISKPIEPSCSIKFDWVWLSSITEQFDWMVGITTFWKERRLYLIGPQSSPQKLGWGFAAHSVKPLPYFPTLFQTCPGRARKPYFTFWGHTYLSTGYIMKYPTSPRAQVIIFFFMQVLKTFMLADMCKLTVHCTLTFW